MQAWCSGRRRRGAVQRIHRIIGIGLLCQQPRRGDRQHQTDRAAAAQGDVQQAARETAVGPRPFRAQCGRVKRLVRHRFLPAEAFGHLERSRSPQIQACRHTRCVRVDTGEWFQETPEEMVEIGGPTSATAAVVLRPPPTLLVVSVMPAANFTTVA